MKNSEALRILHALETPEVRDFVKTTLKEDYKRYFKGHEVEVEEMIEKVFSFLSKSKSSALSYVANTINHELFGKDDPEFWFNKMYFKYKKDLRPKEDMAKIRPWILGKTVLDFGCGAGFLALELEKEGYHVLTTDVLQYRIPEVFHLPFRKMSTPFDVPDFGRNIDTTIARTVLHHVNPRYLRRLLRKIKSVTKRRIIIQEDVYDISRSSPLVSSLVKKQRNLKKFLSMPGEIQLSCLILKDFFANAIGFGHSDINFSFAFKTLPEWESVLKNVGIQIKKVIVEGFEENRLTTNCQVWLICDSA